MHKTKQIFFFISFVFFALALSSFLASAQNNPGNPIDIGSSQKTMLVATVNVGGLEVKKNSESSFEVSFDIKNLANVQPGIRYAVDLAKEENSRQNIVYRKVYDETLSLGAGETVHKTVGFEVPKYLSGEYTFVLEVATIDGLSLGNVPGEKFTFAGSGREMEINSESCRIDIGGKKMGFDVNSKIKLLPNEPATFICQAKNNSDEEMKIFPQAVIYEKSIFGKILAEKKSGQLDVGAGKQKEFQIGISDFDGGQFPLISISLLDDEAQPASQSLDLPATYGMLPPLVLNVRFDKDYYKKGETGNITLDMREIKLESPMLAYSIVDNNNLSCTDEKTNEQKMDGGENGTFKFSVKIAKDCFDPTLKLTIKDNSGSVLDKNEYYVKSKFPEAARTKEEEKQSALNAKKIQLAVLIILGIIFLAILTLHIVRIIKYRNYRFPIIFLFISFGFLFCAKQAFALTYVYDEYPDNNTYGIGNELTFTINLDPLPPEENHTAYYYPDEATESVRGSIHRELYTLSCSAPAYDPHACDAIWDLNNKAANATFVAGINAETDPYQHQHSSYGGDGLVNCSPSPGQTCYSGPLLYQLDSDWYSGNFVYGCNSNGDYPPTVSYPSMIVYVNGKKIAEPGTNDTFTVKSKGKCGYGWSGPSGPLSCNVGCLINDDYSNLFTTGQITWTCQGMGGIYDPACSDNVIFDGKCSWPSGAAVCTLPGAGPNKFCEAPRNLYFPQILTKLLQNADGTWGWTCRGTGGRPDASCQTTPGVKATCGSAAGQPTMTPPTANLCGPGSVATSMASLSPAKDKWTWQCDITGGVGCNVSCEAPVGCASDAQNMKYLPGRNWPFSNPDLCANNGTASGLSGNGTSINPYTWSCAGSSLVNGVTVPWTAPNCQAQRIDAGLTVNNQPNNVTVTAGLSVPFAWSSFNANSCQKYANPADSTNWSTSYNNSFSGSFPFSPPKNSTYYFQCRVMGTGLNNKYFYDTASVQVTVNPSCGPAVNNTYCNAPANGDPNLCLGGGAASPIDTTDKFLYKWTCGLPPQQVSCSAKRFCSSDTVWKEIGPGQ